MPSFLNLSDKSLSFARVFIFVTILLSLLTLYVGVLTPYYSYFENRIWNFYQRAGLFKTSHKSRPVVIDVNEPSLEKLGSWQSWPRERLVNLTHILLVDYHVQAVAFDVLFPESKKSDQALLKLAKEHKVIFSQAFRLPNQGGKSQMGVLGGGSSSVLEKKFTRAIGYTANNSTLATAPCIGHISPKKDFDGVSRIPPYISWDDRVYPMLSLEILRCLYPDEFTLESVESSLLRYSKIKIRKEKLTGNKDTLRLDKEGYWKVPYTIDQENDISSVSVLDVLDHKAPLSLLDNQIVIVASTAAGLSDQHVTPLSANSAGVAVHIQILEWLLSESVVVDDEGIENLTLIWTVISLLLLYALLIKRLSVIVVILAVVGLSIFWLGLGFFLWIYWNGWLPMLPLFGYALFAIFQIPSEWALVQRKSRYLRDLFGGYLPTAVLESVVKDNTNEVLQPQRRCLTILFADIADFTQRSEESSPEAIAKLTQEILCCLTQVVYEQQGTLDKYMGDAVMAFWNAPLDQKNHADFAVTAGLKMIRAIQEYNRHSTLINNDPIKICIGIHTGDAIVGDLGTKLRKSYTAIGDSVNVAARLQDKAKSLRENVLISEETYSLLKGDHPLEKYSTVQLRGRKKEVSIYVLSA